MWKPPKKQKSVYLSLLRDGSSPRKKVLPFAEAFSPRSMAAADAERHGLHRARFRHL